MNGDLISRSALIQHAYSAVVDGVEKDIIDLSDVDNAPTVQPEKVLIANVSFDEDKLKEIVQTEVIDKIKSGELVLKNEKPQGNIRWTDKVFVTSSGDIIDFEGMVVGHINLEELKGGAE